LSGELRPISLLPASNLHSSPRLIGLSLLLTAINGTLQLENIGLDYDPRHTSLTTSVTV